MNTELNVASACELVRLALQLAHERGMSDPRPFLPEAARLVTEARITWDRELQRFKNEGEFTEEMLADQIAWEGRNDYVPFEKLCSLGTDKGKHYESFSYTTINKGQEEQVSFSWLKFNSERGFQDCLRRYAALNHVSDTKRKEAFKNLWLAAKADELRIVDVLYINHSRATANSARASKGGKAKAEKTQKARARVEHSPVN